MEEYISDNSVYARAKSNSMINPKMIGRVLEEKIAGNDFVTCYRL